jgi:hypothetical protein
MISAKFIFAETIIPVKPTHRSINHAEMLILGNLDQAITQLDAPHDFWPSGTNHLNSA